MPENVVFGNLATLSSDFLKIKYGIFAMSQQDISSSITQNSAKPYQHFSKNRSTAQF
jgi:hypothetical protein